MHKVVRVSNSWLDKLKSHETHCLQTAGGDERTLLQNKAWTED